MRVRKEEGEREKRRETEELDRRGGRRGKKEKDGVERWNG
jgi:hypothetical protein